jgi:hypothetical protein
MSTTFNNYNNKLQGYAGNSKDIFCAVLDASGNAYDLTGYSAYLYAKKFPVRAEADLDVSIGSSSIDPSNGAIVFNLSSSALDLTPGDYVYEIVIDNGAGTVISVVQDRLNLLKSIS